MTEGRTNDAIEALNPLIRQKGIVGQEARSMLGDLRIRQVLSPTLCKPDNYVVRRGDSWLGIARKTKCPLDYIIHVNQLMELGSLQIGQVVKVKELNYRVEINVPLKEISIWEGDSFIKSYPVVMMKDEGRSNFSTTVKSESAVYRGGTVSIHSPDFASADKAVLLAHGGLVIESSADGKMRKPGFYLKREDCNELSLLLRAGNKVDIIREAQP